MLNVVIIIVIIISIIIFIVVIIIIIISSSYPHHLYHHHDHHHHDLFYIHCVLSLQTAKEWIDLKQLTLTYGDVKASSSCAVS
jgi:hypothetical protein